MDKSVNLRETFDLANSDFPKGTPFWLDASFHTFFDANPQLHQIANYLPDTLNEVVFDSQFEIEKTWSSYKDHGYGYLFYALVRVLKPVACVELGVLQGFSLLTVAAALRDNDNGGMINGFDLFEDYEYRHDALENVTKRIKENQLETWARLFRSDAFQVYKQFDMIDYLHVDISNNGETLMRIFNQWKNKVKQVIIFEGGSDARDQVEWMSKYGKAPIVTAINAIRTLSQDWDIVVLKPYPSVTLAIRRGGEG